jgi:type IV pilus assembly protein PilM
MSFLSALSESPAPGVAVEIAASRVAAASLDWRGGSPVVAAHGIEPLPDGALTPALLTSNLHDRAAVAAALGRVLEQVGRPRRIGLIVPDTVAKVSLVKFERVPAKAQDLDQLVRWQVRKAAPFPIEEAQVSYVPGLRAADGQEFIVSLARRSVIEEYEGLCAEAGAHAGLVDLSTFNVINAVLAGAAPPTADWLLVNVSADDTTIALLRGPHLIFFRNRVADADGTLLDLVHQTTMYYEDRLQGAGFSRAILAGGYGDLDGLRRSIEERVKSPVELIDPTGAAALTDRITAAPTLLGTLAPLVGLLLRDHERATA